MEVLLQRHVGSEKKKKNTGKWRNKIITDLEDLEVRTSSFDFSQ